MSRCRSAQLDNACCTCRAARCSAAAARSTAWSTTAASQRLGPHGGADNAGWAYADVLPYFRRSETFHRATTPIHGDSGPAPGLAPRREAPLRARLRRGRPAGRACAQRRQQRRQPRGLRSCRRHDRARRALQRLARLSRPARRRPNLSVVTGAHATRILLENAAPSASSTCAGAALERRTRTRGARSAAARSIRRSC